MANTILTPTMITKEALMVLENNLTFAKHVNRKYDDQFAKSGAKIGATLNVRKPARYTVSSGAALSVQDFTETQVPLVINAQKHVDVTFTSQELTLSIQDFSQRVLAPAIAALANQIDADGLALAAQVYNSVGTPGTVPNTSSTYLNAGALLDKTGTPRDGNRALAISPDMQATIIPALQGLFSPVATIGEQYTSGTMGPALGFKWNMDQNVLTRTSGALGGTPLVNGASQVGASLVTDGWTASAATRVKAGDVFTIANVFATNPQNQAVSAGYLQQFVALADGASDGSGNMTISISPSIVTSGANQNVTNSPADNAALTFIAAASTTNANGLAFHRDAFTLASVDLEDVSSFGSWGARVADKQLGISMRVARQYAIGTDTIPCRIDVLYGWSLLRPEMACRIQS